MIRTVAYYCIICLLSPLIVVGLVGNCLSMLTWSRGSHRDTSTAVLLTALAVSDTLVLAMPALEFWTTELFGTWLRNLNVIVCKSFAFFAFFGPVASSCILVLVTAERVTSMLFPVKVRYMCTRLKVGLCLFVTLIMLAALYGPILVATNLFPQDENGTITDWNDTNATIKCTIKTDGDFMNYYYKAMMWIDFCSLFLVPSTLIAIGNALILYKIFASRHIFVKNGQNITYRTRIANSFTIRAIALSITFFVCTSPVAIYEVYLAYTDRENVNQVFYVLIHIVLYGNSSINFILYCVIGTGFRNDLKNVLSNTCFRKKLNFDKQDTTGSVMHSFFTRSKANNGKQRES